MGLSKLNIPTYKVEYGGQQLEFRGLSFNMLVGLISKHRADLDRLYELATEMSDDEDLSRLLMLALEEMPDLVNSVIATSAGEPEATEHAAMINFPMQVKILEEIYDLTLREIGGAGKLLKLVGNLFQKITNGLSKEADKNTGS